MLRITVPDMNDSFSFMSINDVGYYLRFTYNETGDFWSFGLYDNDQEPIITGVKVVPGFFLMLWYNDRRLPKGDFAVIYEGGRVGRNAFVNGEAKFYYMSAEEM